MTLIHAVSGEEQGLMLDWSDLRRGQEGKKGGSDPRQCHLKCGYGEERPGSQKGMDDENQ